MDDVIKLALLLFAVIGIPVAAYVGYRYAMMWLRRYELEGEMLAGMPAESAARFEALEAQVLELQERLDFAERLLAQGPMHEPERLEERTPV